MNPKLPIDVIVNRGKKHLTKAEIEQRKNETVRPGSATMLVPPSYLTKKQKAEFDRYAAYVEDFGVEAEADSNSLAKYVIANEQYLKAVKKVNAAMRDPETKPDNLMKLVNIQDKFLNESERLSARFGFTPVDRARLMKPKSKEEKPVSKFAEFDGDFDA